MQAIFNSSHIKFSFVFGLFFSSNYSVRLQPVPAGLPAFICTKVTYRVWEKTCHVGNSSSWTGLQKIVSCFIVQHYSVIDIYTILAIGTKLSSKLSAKKRDLILRLHLAYTMCCIIHILVLLHGHCAKGPKISAVQAKGISLSEKYLHNHKIGPPRGSSAHVGIDYTFS